MRSHEKVYVPQEKYTAVISHAKKEMSGVALIRRDAKVRLKREDPTLREIQINYGYSDKELNSLLDCMLAHPNVVSTVQLSNNCASDVTGVKVARYVAISSTIKTLIMAHNEFTEATHLAIAKALLVNTSLRAIVVYNNTYNCEPLNRSLIDTAFAVALHFNQNRHPRSIWRLYGQKKSIFNRLRAVAETYGPPSMLSLLRQCDRARTKTKIREICFFLTTKNV